MRAIMVKAVLDRKIKEWIDSIDDEKVKQLCRDNTIVTGGAIPSLLISEEVNDFDIYFRNKETTLAVAHYYVDKFKENPPPKFADGRNIEIFIDAKKDDRVSIVIKSAGVASEDDPETYGYFESQSPENNEAYINDVAAILNKDEPVKDDTEEQTKEKKKKKKSKYRPIFITGNAITLSDRIQIVTRFFGEPDVIHTNFDFVHCTCYWDSKTKELVLPPAALESILTKHLHFVGSKYPICSIIRIRKFIKRGWNITAGQILKMCLHLNELDLTDMLTLQEQLIGVDTAYFQTLIDMLKTEKEKNTELKLDSMYICKIIDTIF